MLILKRRPRQTVQIGSDITIRVIGIEAGAVVLGISAPSETPITRTVVVTLDESPHPEPAPDGPATAPTRPLGVPSDG